jgi:hypothetical protein
MRPQSHLKATLKPGGGHQLSSLTGEDAAGPQQGSDAVFVADGGVGVETADAHAFGGVDKRQGCAKA